MISKKRERPGPQDPQEDWVVQALAKEKQNFYRSTSVPMTMFLNTSGNIIWI